MNPFEIRFNCLQMSQSIVQCTSVDGSKTQQAKQKALFLLAAKLYLFTNGDFEKLPELADIIKVEEGRKVFRIDVGSLSPEEAQAALTKIKNEIHTHNFNKD